ncbi:MAG TPA: CpsB/CapC family capsule biosynthesis tyrosine phosphatase [Burkholderiales bacterium]|nr:CpsB/CapC family capsule biosynthesis tyrosine phosphatase [Burkholderiales bacterium]
MIDLHNHFLPGIDDGAQTLDESLALARAAVAAGVKVAVMTPHVHPIRYDNTRASIARAYEDYATAVSARGIPLEVRMAGEVRISDDVMRMVDEDEIPYLGVRDGYRTLLLEFPPAHLMVGGEKLVQWLVARRIRPVIAHPERNKEVARDVDKLRPYLALGCMLQVTAGSLVGQFGKDIQRCAVTLVEREWVAAVASDAHNMDHRPPNLDVARDALTEIGGAALATQLTEHGPAAILGLQ